MINISDIFSAFQIAVLAYVIAAVLMSEGGILERYYDLLLDLRDSGRLGAVLSKPLGLCEKCLTGQLALWTWLYMNYADYFYNPFEALLKHSIFISFSILFVITIKTIFSKWK